MFGSLHAHRTHRALVVGALVVAAACARAPGKLSPEAAKAKGDELLREMSKSLGSLQTFSYTAAQVREAAAGGAKSERFTQRVIIRRPNAIAITSEGDQRDNAAWYDGKQLTLMSNRQKVWARGPMPPTLDEGLDYLAHEYAIPLPTADLLYSSPYDALMTSDTTGGWVDVQKVGDVNCDHLSYQQQSADWEIWLGEARRLPCKFRIVYKNEPGQPSTTVIFSDLNLSPQVTDDTFVAKVPDGYQRLKIMRHASVNDPTVTPADSEGAKPEPAATKK